MLKVLISAIKAYAGSFSGLSIKTWYGIIICFIQATLAGIFYFLSYYFVHILNFNVKTAGFLISSYGMGAILGGFLGGKLSDKYAPTKISFICLILQAVAFILLSQ